MPDHLAGLRVNPDTAGVSGDSVCADRTISQRTRDTQARLLSAWLSRGSDQWKHSFARSLEAHSEPTEQVRASNCLRIVSLSGIADFAWPLSARYLPSTRCPGRCPGRVRWCRRRPGVGLEDGKSTCVWPSIMALREPSSAAATQTVVQRAAAPVMLSFSWSIACLIQTPVSSDELPASHVGAGRYQRALAENKGRWSVEAARGGKLPVLGCWILSGG